MSDAVIRITDNARAVLALAETLDSVERDIKLERDRHRQAMQALSVKQQALQDAIFKLGGSTLC
jgi:hypothetical protein